MVELVWSGKYDGQGRRISVARQEVCTSILEQHVGADGAAEDRLVLGDNLAALDALLSEGLGGTIDLAYLDPPFGTGGRFAVSTRVGDGGPGGRAPPEIEQPAYTDRFDGGVDGLLAMLDPRLRRVHELLSPHGSLYLHVDPTLGHAAKLLLDEIFGASCFQREIVWRIGWVSGFKTKARNWIRNHDLIFFYTKDPKTFVFNKIYTPYPPDYRRRDGSPPKGQGMPIEDVWNANDTELALRGRDSLDSIQIKSFSAEKSGYATQKNESLLRRIIAASCNEGDVVLDPFCGSGSTGAAARELGRRFIGCDASAAALHIAKKRMLRDAPARGVRYETVDAGGWQRAASDASWWSRLLEALEVDAPGQADEHGLCWVARAQQAVAVLEPTRTVDGPMLRALIERAGARGLRSLEVVARSFALPWPRPAASMEVSFTRIGDEWLAPTFVPPAPPPFASGVGRGGLRELFEVDLAIERPGGNQLDLPGTSSGDRLAVTITDVRYRSAQTWPPVLAACESFADFVDAWWLQWADRPPGEVPPTPDEHHFRTHQRRELPVTSVPRPVREGSWLRIVVHDVLHQRTQVEGRLRATAEGWTLTDGVQR